MAFQNVNVGAAANDGTGDQIRTAFQKVNSNFSQATTDLAGKADASHNHDSRYYTETEVNSLLAGKAAAAHDHDDRYYTEDEVDTMLAGVGGGGGGGGDMLKEDYDSDEDGKVDAAAVADAAPWAGITGKPSTFPPDAHTHDDRYYTESEVDAALAGKSDTGHDHDSRYYTETEVDTALAGKANTSHTHDDRYYTEAETDTLLAAKANASALADLVTNGGGAATVEVMTEAAYAGLGSKDANTVYFLT